GQQIADVVVDGGSVGAVASYSVTNVTAPHTIAATFAPITYTITATAGSNGTISPGGAIVANCGTNQTLTITPDGCYQIQDVLVDGSSVGAVSSYTFTNLAANHTIDASFVGGDPIITVTQGANGTIAPTGPLTVTCHADQSFTITPDPCYHIVDVVVDGTSRGAVTSYAFT